MRGISVDRAIDDVLTLHEFDYMTDGQRSDSCLQRAQ